MARSSIQSASIYSISLLIFLLGYRLRTLQACPLPSNASCSECHVLRYIQLDVDNRQLNINLSVELDLVLTQNTAKNFLDTINSVVRHDDFSFEAHRKGSAKSCLDNDPYARSPCSHDIQMAGADVPTCRWNYTCEYSPNRFPQYLWRAHCAGSAHPIFYKIPTLTLESEGGNDCLPFTGAQTVYRWGLEKVAVACSCANS